MSLTVRYDYTTFGMEMPGRHSSSGDYRYGFNGMEGDDEIKGEKNSYDFGARIYDTRVGRWLTIDPLSGKYPSTSPYVFVLNSPILFIDPDGRKVRLPYDYEKLALRGINRLIRLSGDRAGASFRPKLDYDKENNVIFETKRDVRRATRYSSKNINSKDPDARILATLYQAILSDDPADEIVVPFDEVSYEEAKANIQSLGSRVNKQEQVGLLNQEVIKVIDTDLAEILETKNPTVPETETKDKTPKGEVPPSSTGTDAKEEWEKKGKKPKSSNSRATGADLDKSGKDKRYKKKKD